MTAFQEAMARTLAGLTLANRYAGSAGGGTLPERKARAERFAWCTLVMRMGTWRPTFPYYLPGDR